jgi:hypothetical protein
MGKFPLDHRYPHSVYDKANDILSDATTFGKNTTQHKTQQRQVQEENLPFPTRKAKRGRGDED